MTLPRSQARSPGKLLASLSAIPLPSWVWPVEGEAGADKGTALTLGCLASSGPGLQLGKGKRYLLYFL